MPYNESMNAAPGTETQITEFDQLLEQFRALHQERYATEFEAVILSALRSGKTLFGQQIVASWRPEGRDVGTDLVAQLADGSTVGVQVKCYLPESTVPTSAVDSFVADAASKHQRMVLVATTDNVAAVGAGKFAAFADSLLLGRSQLALWLSLPQWRSVLGLSDATPSESTMPRRETHPTLKRLAAARRQVAA